MRWWGSEGPQEVPQPELLWALGSICALHRLPFMAELVQREFPAPCTHATLVSAGRALGLRIKAVRLDPSRIARLALPLLVALKGAAEKTDGDGSLGIVTAAAEGKVVLFRAGTNTPQTLADGEFADVCSDTGWLAAPLPERTADTEAAGTTRRFGFGWFVPELLKHKRHLARRAARVARHPADRARHAALHAGDHRQGGRAPDTQARWS